MSTTLNKARSILADTLREKSGFELSDIDADATFLDLGFDSLFLIQLSQTLRQRSGVKVTFRQLIEEVNTVDSLLSYLANQLPNDANDAAQNVERALSTEAVAETSQANTAQVEDLQPAVASTFAAPSPKSLESFARPKSEVEPTPPPDQVVPTKVPGVASLQPVQAMASSLPPVAPTLPTTSPEINAPGTALQQIVLQQTQLMSQHLQLLSGTTPTPSAIAGSGPDLTATNAAQMSAQECGRSISKSVGCVDSRADGDSQSNSAAAIVVKPEVSAVDASMHSTSETGSKRTEAPEKPSRFGPYKPVRKGPGQGLTDQQRQHLETFVARYTKKTEGSRKHAQEHRDYFADPRGVAGYRRIWKTMVYQIVVEHSKGSKLRDIDGNEYVDIAMGFGLNLFGQSPEFITEAIRNQLDRGVEVGPQTPIAGEVARLLADFSRKDRVTFCNTGSEAVMAALRLARTVTGKSKCVFFNKDYHGNFDEVLLRSNRIGKIRRTSPAAPGVPQQFADNAIVLDYGTEEALQVLRERADEIASVLIEPVQSADPFIQPQEFLREVRKITSENDIAMIMDEVISGFRAAQGGAQEWFDVWGDMATYGKVLGGGLPIGALAGSSRFMDALDGGTWKYEDESEPEADMTFFAGTFVRHPLGIAAAHQVLMKVKEEGPQLQERLTERTTGMVNRLNRFFEQEQFPIRVAQFTSLFRFMFPPDLEYADMLYFHLLDRGIFTRGWGDNCFLSTEHSDEDVERIVAAVQESCLEIRAGGFFPQREGGLHQGQKPGPSHSHALSCSIEPSECGQAERQDEETGIAKLSQGIVNSRDLVAAGKAEVERLDVGCLISEIQPEGSKPPLFCTPAADGLTLVYHDLADALSKDQPVYGLTSAGVFGEELPGTLEEFCARFVEEIKSIQPEGPYHLLGYCSGGTVAYEIAQQLKRAGDEVALLACVETYNWQFASSTNPTLWVQSGYQAQRLYFLLKNFLLLSRRQKVAFFQSKWERILSRLDGFKSQFKAWFQTSKSSALGAKRSDKKLVDMNELWRIHDILCEEYRPSHYPGRLLQFRPAKDYSSHLTDVEVPADQTEWIRLKAYPAGTMTPPFVEELAQRLAAEMYSQDSVSCSKQTHQLPEIETCPNLSLS